MRGCAASDAPYWDVLANRWEEARLQRVWRRDSDAVNSRLLSGWLPESCGASVLKTDLFDEAVGRGLCAVLRGKAGRLVGIDLSRSVVRRAVRRAVRQRAGLRGLVADVRSRPFADESFDGVVSLSTLDHFESVEEIATSLGEVHRVLRPGGRWF